MLSTEKFRFQVLVWLEFILSISEVLSVGYLWLQVDRFLSALANFPILPIKLGCNRDDIMINLKIYDT